MKKYRIAHNLPEDTLTWFQNFLSRVTSTSFIRVFWTSEIYLFWNSGFLMLLNFTIRLHLAIIENTWSYQAECWFFFFSVFIPLERASQMSRFLILKCFCSIDLWLRIFFLCVLWLKICRQRYMLLTSIRQSTSLFRPQLWRG